MGFFSKLLLLPLAPVGGVIWLAEQLERIAREEYLSEESIQRELVEWQLAADAGEISPEEYLEVEDALLARLDEARSHREGVSVHAQPPQ
jgi:hypothetical protein